MNCCKGEGGGLLELGAQWIHGGSQENSVWREAKRAGLLGEVDEEEVGRVVDATGNKVDEVLAEKAWRIYQQVWIARKVFMTSGDPSLDCRRG